MEHDAAKALALNLMGSHGLIDTGWVFAFDKATSRMGVTIPSRKRITISAPMVAVADQDFIQQIMLHEIAHALLPAGTGHGPACKARAAAIGYRGSRTAANPLHTTPAATPATTGRPATIGLAPKPFRALLRVGQAAVITGGQKRLRGTRVTVTAVRRTRYQVRTETGQMLAAPFELIAAA